MNPRFKNLNETQKKQYTDGKVFTICYSKKAAINYYWDLLPNQIPDNDVSITFLIEHVLIEHV